MKKVISFCLWEQDKETRRDQPHIEQYYIGAILNADIAKKYWEDWICRYYIDSSTVPESLITELKSRDNVEVVLFENNEGYFSTLWRFYAIGDDLDYVICRDVDSRLNVRDKAAVDEWISSNEDFHIMRDHCQHTRPIAAGMFGAKGGVLPNMSELINMARVKSKQQNQHNWFGIDQLFLEKIIYPYVKKRSLIHDEWTDPTQLIFAGEKKRPFPIPRETGDGWWERDLPEWHSGIEDDADKYPHWQPPDGPGHCFLKCPACNTFHDNEYIGKHRFITSDEKKKYEHIMKDIL